MKLKYCIEKLDSYKDRLDAGKASKIKRHHVEKVIEKLEKKIVLLAEEIDATEKPSKRDRLSEKQKTAHEQIERANWLLKQLSQA